MQAIAYQQAGDIERNESLCDIELPVPVPGERDILVEVRAISVNPVDTKVRSRAAPENGQWKVLGWDAAGVVTAVGAGVTLFSPGDEVYYSGDLGRPGTNAQFHLVDERIAAMKPQSLDFAAAAALPLTSITAWETLFDRLRVDQPVAGAAAAVLVIGGAGGVGSIAIQLLRALTGLTVIATASRPQTGDWVRQMGAHHVIDHAKPLAAQVAQLGLGAPAFVFSTTQTHLHLEQIAELISPQGRFALIDDPATLDINVFKRKSVSVHWEFMFTRSMFGTADIAEQGKLLTRVAGLVDEGKLRSTVTEVLTPIDADNLKKAHRMLESGQTRGKLVLQGFDAPA
jgi:NADPH2:quinone reductase